MPTKRRRILPKRIGRQVPEWAKQLLAGRLPPEPADCEGYIGWRWFDEDTPGLPSSTSDEGLALIAAAQERRRAN